MVEHFPTCPRFCPPDGTLITRIEWEGLLCECPSDFLHPAPDDPWAWTERYYQAAMKALRPGHEQVMKDRADLWGRCQDYTAGFCARLLAAYPSRLRFILGVRKPGQTLDDLEPLQRIQAMRALRRLAFCNKEAQQ